MIHSCMSVCSRCASRGEEGGLRVAWWRKSIILTMKSSQFMFLSVTTGVGLTHSGTTFPCIGANAHKLHFPPKYGSPTMVWFGNKVTTFNCFQDTLRLPVCLFAQGVEQGPGILGCQTSGWFTDWAAAAWAGCPAHKYVKVINKIGDYQLLILA